MTGKEQANRNIYLCGFMATGKSSVGKRLASLLDYDFIDMDAVIEEEEGMAIPQIFSGRGEPAFRLVESSLVRRLAAESGKVVATGGGAVANPGNLELMKGSGTVITLTADPGIILARVGSGRDRPMLRGGDKAGRIAALMRERAHAYAQADITVDTSSMGIDETARHIRALLERRPEA
ncbi:MAG: shikimate kinase [Acidobacteria bacterium]|nr:shikimate kinase [Acidobacteriota bacterium]